MVAKRERTIYGWMDGWMEWRGARLGSCRCWRKKEGRKEGSFVGAVRGGEGREMREIDFMGKERDEEEEGLRIWGQRKGTE